MFGGQLISKALTSGLKKFEGNHRGEACYIIGDGPSIKWFDFERFSDLPAICCGMIPFHADFEMLDVRYLAMVEPWLFVPDVFRPSVAHLNQLKLIANEYKKLIPMHRDKEFFVNLSNAPFVRGPNVNYVHKQWPILELEDDDSVLKDFNLFGGSFHATLTLAYYMGFTKCYLIGFDAWTVQPSRTMRWYEHGTGEFFQATNFAFDFLSVLKKKMEIYSIILDGESCNTIAVNYKDYAGTTPVFRENSDLLSPQRLAMIASCAEYRVYPSKTVEA